MDGDSKVVTDYQKPGLHSFASEIRSMGELAPKIANATIRKPFRPSSSSTLPAALGFPGTGSPGASLNPINDAFTQYGLHARTWGHYTNLGPTIRAVPRMVRQIRETYAETGQPIIGYGHSLGGIYHLYLARQYPELYSHVIGFAAPCNLELQDAYTKTNCGFAFKLMETFKPMFQERLMRDWTAESKKEPLVGVQRTMFIAKRDGIVDPLSCELPDHDGCKNFYLDTKHADIITDAVATEIAAHVMRHGNDSKLPLSLARHLITRDDVEEFQRAEFDPIAVLRGAGHFVARGIGNTVSRTTSTIYGQVNAPVSRIRAQRITQPASIPQPSGASTSRVLARTPIVAAPSR